jgi:hypothetical protein
MAKATGNALTKPLSEKELTAFLLWLYTESGSRCQVEAWRAARAAPAAGAAANDDDH